MRPLVHASSSKLKASRPRYAPMAKVTKRGYFPYLIFTLCAGLYLFPFMRLLLQTPPEGLLVYGAVRIVHGQVFARDFFEVVGPGTFYWLALFFKLFGVTFAATRICLFVTSLGTGLSDVFPVAQDMQPVPDSSLHPIGRHLFRNPMAVDQPSRG